MALLESAYFAVEQLAKDFKSNENHYLRPEYSETRAYKLCQVFSPDMSDVSLTKLNPADSCQVRKT